MILFMLAGAAFPSFGQKSRADRLFNSKQYYAAAQLYEKIAGGEKGGSRVEVQLQAGMCYMRISRPQAALPWFRQIIDGGNADGNVWYQYGLALQQTGDYRGAIGAFEQCIRLWPGNMPAAAGITSCEFALRNNRINPYGDYRLAVGVNTAGSEFGISLFTGNMVCYSVAKVSGEVSKTDERTGLQYAEPYAARIHGRQLVNPQEAGDAIPQYASTGLFAYDSIAQRLYFNYCNPDDNRCGIYFSQFKNSKWSAPEIVLPGRKNEAIGHPAIANGGKRLYFVSSSSEGIGQTDIWYVDQNKNGRWGQAVNVGNAVNTPEREEFPFVYADTLLFFASSGHVGYGGLDIFCSVIKGNTFSPPVNLRRPYNSQGDDFNLVIAGNTGLMSSSRNEMVNDDIYMFDGLPSSGYFSGTVSDASSGVPVKGARLTLSVDGKAVQNAVSDTVGYYGFFLKGGNTPMIYVRASGYKSFLSDVKVDITEPFADNGHEIQLQPSSAVPITISLYDKITNKPVAERGIICFNTDGENQILRTGVDGVFKLVAQEGQREYWIKFPDGYYLTESVLLNGEQTSYSLGMQPFNSELFSGWLQFKVGSTEATEMSQPLILRIAAIIKANPGIVFQIAGYRDTATEARQPDLAGLRAEYIMRRLIEEGIDSQQLAVIAGKQTTVRNRTVSEEEYAAQRKVEITVKR